MRVWKKARVVVLGYNQSLESCAVGEVVCDTAAPRPGRRIFAYGMRKLSEILLAGILLFTYH